MISRLKGITWRYYLYSFFGSLSFYVAVLVPFYTDFGNISLTQVQVLQAWLMFWALALEIPTGVVADRFGRKQSVALGSFMAVIAALIYATIPSFGAFLVAEFLFAAGLALTSGAGEALLYDSLKEEGNKQKFKDTFGKAFSIGQFSAIIAAPLGGVIAARYGINIPMLVSTVPYFIATLLILTAREPETSLSKRETRPSLDIAKSGIHYFRNHKILRTLAIDAILVYTGAYFLIWLYQPMLQSLGVAIVFFGIIRAVFSLSGIAFTSKLQFTENLFGSAKNFFRSTVLITTSSLLLIAMFPSTLTVLLALVLVGGLGQARFTSINSNMNKYIPSEQRATVLSAIGMLNKLVLVSLNPIVGFIADHSLRGAFIVVGLLPLTSFIFFKHKKLVEE